MVDDIRAPDLGYAAVRFVHLSPNAPIVDIAVLGGPVLFSDVTFKSATTYIQVPAGTYNLGVKVAGTGTVVLKAPASFEAASVYTVFAEGLVGGKDPLLALGALIQYDGM